MTDSAEMKRMSEVAEWLNAKEGYDWARYTFAAIRYGREQDYKESWGTYGFYSLKPANDNSGSERDFTASLGWGLVPGDEELQRMDWDGIRTTVVLLHNPVPQTLQDG